MTETEKARISRLGANLTASQPEGGYLLGSAPERPSESRTELPAVLDGARAAIQRLTEAPVGAVAAPASSSPRTMTAATSSSAPSQS
mgnify:CR=1 FL=1